MRRGRRTIVVVCLVLVSSTIAMVNHASQEASAYITRGPVRIESNAEFTPANGVVGGTGTPTDPYIIEGWEIDVRDAGASGVLIVQTTAHFVVRSCYVIGTYSAVSPGIMLVEVENGWIENNVVLDTWAGVGLYRSHGISAIDNMAQGNRHGIKLDHSYGIIVGSNNVSSNGWGIGVLFSYDNHILGNDIYDNGVGMEILYDGSEGNIIAHNNFIQNYDQAVDGTLLNNWDDGYPSGGNFWSDYVGVDNCSGPDQDICPDPDGIGDVPYVVDIGIEDRYPLMHLNGSRDVQPPIPEGQVNSPRTMGNITINQMRSRDGEGGIYTVEWLETLRSRFDDIQALRPQPEPLETDEIQKLEISRTQNKFQCLNVHSAKRN